MKFYTVIISILVSIAAFAQAPGSLDLSFAGTGYASYGPVASNFMDNAQDVVTLANGKMIYCGTSGMTSSLGIVVVRLNCDGTIDNTFGTNGYYLYNAPGGSSFAYDMELLPNGQLLIAGATSITAANPQFTMLRLNSNGTLDQTFGVNGFFNNDIGSGEDYARKILIQNNKIILVGASKTPGFSTNRLALTQCDMNGVLDLTFGTSGTTVFQNAANNSCFGQSAVIGNNNDIFICGDAYINNIYYPLLAKVSATGVPYAAFGSNGVLIPMNFNARFFDIEYDGSKLIMAGQNNVGPWDFLLQARNTTDGALVTTFGTAGSSIIDVVQADTYYELLIHPDGSLLACGTTGTAGIGAARDFIISKYNANGILQTSFGTNGHTVTNIAPAWDDAYGMDLYPGNKIVVAGFSAQTNTQHAVARYAYGPATPVLGCTDPLSCNYNCLATVNDGSCLYPNTACNDGNPLTINDSTNANCVCAGQLVTTIPGCMNPAACNYNPLATVDDGSCILPGTPCNDNNPNTINDIIDANCNCTGTPIVPGCMNPAACNYNPLANVDNNSCLFPGLPCDDGNPNTINDSINPDCLCTGIQIVEGCTDPNSCSYDPLANVDNNTCIYPDSPCDDNNPDTFNDVLDSLCNCVGTLYVSGCMDPNACNYNPLANIDDQSCVFPGSPCDDGNALTINDSLDVNCNCVGLDISGLNEHLFEFELNPNPATDLFLLVTSSVAVKTISILDLQGKVLKEMNVNGTTQLIDCSTLASGSYLIKVRMNGVEKMKKNSHSALMQEQHFSFQQTRRYYQSELKGKQHILIALHGYGQLAQFFFRKFAHVPDNWGILVPEGPHRFYLEGSSGRVGASWMTKEWRHQDIADNNAYLQQLIEIMQETYPLATLHLLGFSQGGATAARLFQSYSETFKQLILWASVFPPDIEKNDFPKGKKLDFILGKQDPYFDSEKQQNVLTEYSELGFDNHSFEGGHDIEPSTLLKVLQAD